MSAPYITMAAAVDITQSGPRLEARSRQTGQLLGTAQRAVDADGSPAGWLVMCGRRTEQVATVTTARFTLLNAASSLDGVR